MDVATRVQRSAAGQRWKSGYSVSPGMLLVLLLFVVMLSGNSYSPHIFASPSVPPMPLSDYEYFYRSCNYGQIGPYKDEMGAIGKGLDSQSSAWCSPYVSDWGYWVTFENKERAACGSSNFIPIADYGLEVFNKRYIRVKSCDDMYRNGFSIERERTAGCPQGYSYNGNTCDLTGYNFLKTAGAMCPITGNPIYPGSGNKYQREVDYEADSKGSISFVRHYNSRLFYARKNQTINTGSNWSNTYTRQINSFNHRGIRLATVVRPDGRAYNYVLDSVNTTWIADEDVKGALEELRNSSDIGTGWRYKTADDVTELYDASGRLLSITDINGGVQTLTYEDTEPNDPAPQNLSYPVRVDSNTGKYLIFRYNSHRLAEMEDHAGRIWKFRYDSNNNLEFVDNPDQTTRQYYYEDTNTPNLNALTGIKDERGQRYATFEYLAGTSTLAGAASASYHGPQTEVLTDRIEGVTIDYDGRQRTLTNSKGVVSTYSSVVQLGAFLITDISGPGCSTCSNGNTAFNYDPANNNLLSKTENGVTTKYGNYDSKGNYRCMVEGVAATDVSSGECEFDPAVSPDAHRTDYSYESRYFSRVATETGPSVSGAGSRVTSYTYDDYGNRTSVTVDGYLPDGTSVSRSTTYEFNGPLNQLSQTDGPRTDIVDITQLRYYPNEEGQGSNRARLMEIEDPTGVLIRSDILYTNTGKVASESRPNGLDINYTYFPGNDRLESVTKTAGGISKVTRWSYLATGEVQTITSADGSGDATTVSFGYDDARRLNRITDGLGNYIEYILDTEGNRREENIHDDAGNIKKALTRSFDAYNRLDLGEHGSDPNNPLESISTDYYPDGTLDQATDGEGVVTDYGYDSLKRLLSSTQDIGGLGAHTQYDYDVNDQLTKVIDPNNGTTRYIYDDLGNLLSTSSPDTGETVYTYDAAGNPQTKKIAAGTAEERQLVYEYDALNRLTRIITPDPADNVTYTWDTCTNGAGNLCQVANGNSVVTYAYDGFGNVTEHQGIGYTYDMANRVKSIVYPSGAILAYTYDPAGQVSRVDLTADGQTTNLATAILYAPFGGIESLDYGNGKRLVQQWDEAYRLTRLEVPDTLLLDYQVYDRNGNLKQRDDRSSTSAIVSNYSYDALNRLNAADGPFGAGWQYEYDLNGNRTLGVEDYQTTFLYQQQSNRLSVIGGYPGILSVSGNTLLQGGWSYSYNSHQRLVSASEAGVEAASFAYNGLGQRSLKSVPEMETKQFRYGLSGNLMEETSSGSSPTVEYYYLNGSLLAMRQVADVAVSLESESAIIGADIDINWQGILNPSVYDWVGVYEVGAGKRQWRDWFYTDGPSSGSKSLSLLHSELEAGKSYELRLYADDLFDLLATSDPFVLQDSIPTVALTSSGAILGGTVNFEWGGLATPTALDWVAIYEVDAGKRRYRDWVYTNGNGSGESSLQLQHAQLVAGRTYELRLYANDVYDLLATSDPFVLQEVAPTVTATSQSAELGETIEASWSGVASPTELDWIGVYEVDTGKRRYRDWVYTDGATSGSISVPLRHSQLVIGKDYELRLFANDGFDLIAASDPFVLEKREVYTGDGIFYVHNDHLGTPQVMTDEAGNVAWRAVYDPFGKATVDAASTVEMNVRFPGHYYDQQTGLHYNYFRYYDPETGRYLTADPIGQIPPPGTTPYKLNHLYAYVGNNPLIGIDPLGLFEYYGNWCGPNHTGGFDKPWDQLTSQEQQNALQPKDDLDSCCQIHDLCHADCRANHPCSETDRKECLNRCDRGIANCAVGCQSGGNRRWMLERYMRGSNPGAGPNVRNCRMTGP